MNLQQLTKNLLSGAFAIGAFCISQAHAATIFSDDFNSENGGTANAATLNYVGFANWTVGPGSVDLIGNGYFDLYAGNGLYVDLDGSTSSAGTMSTSLSLAAGSYVLSFDLGGNQRIGATDVVNVDLGVASGSYALISGAPLATYSIPFTLSAPQSINLSFQNSGGDNAGAILDNVNVSTVPDGGSTIALLGLALTGIAAVRRKMA